MSALIAVAVLIILTSFPVSHPFLTALVKNIVRRSGVNIVSMGAVSLTLSKGISIKDVRVEKRFSGDTRMTVNAAHVQVTFRPLYIASNFKELYDIIRFFFPSARPAAPHILRKRYRLVLGGIPEKAIPAVRAVSIDGAIAGLDMKDTNDVVGVGSRGRILVGDRQPATAHIVVRCDTLAGPFGRIEKFSSGASAAKGVLNIEKIGGRIYGGRISGSGKIDFPHESLAKGSIAVKDMDLNKVYFSGSQQQGTISGRADCSMTFRKSQLRVDSLAADGNFTLSHVTVDQIPLLAGIVISLTVPQLARLEFERMAGRFTFAGGRIECTEVKAKGSPVDLDAEGWITTNGYFEFDVAGTFEPQYKDSLRPLAWNALLPDEDSARRRFECSITGTFDNPRIHLSEKISRRAVRNIFDNIKRDIRSALKR